MVFSLLPYMRDPDYLPDPAPSAKGVLSRINVVPDRVDKPGYDREAFGTWRGQDVPGCTTRTIMLYGGCSKQELAISKDPYSGVPVEREANIEIDHIYPLRAAWDMGAHRWPKSKLEEFANDPANLVAVARGQNQAKSDSLPSAWLPPEKSSRCWYVRRVAAVAWKYQLPLSHKDVQVIRRECWLRELIS
ncbi:MAG: HNH endonuclease family protein [Corynebacterium sp.]|nr:HNH endonuclease family protein [Corynebacterium sp.]